MEQVGNKPDAVDCTNWHGVSDFQDTEVTGFNQGNTHDFKIVWRSGFVDWYVDGQLVCIIRRQYPALPLHFCSVPGARTSRPGEAQPQLDQPGTYTSATSSTHPSGWRYWVTS
jgi:beta-glucanase (GH16 family)